MNRREQAVLNFIDQNFEPGAVRIEDFPLFPYGKRLIDRDGGEMVVFFDLLRDQVDWTYPDSHQSPGTPSGRLSYSAPSPRPSMSC